MTYEQFKIDLAAAVTNLVGEEAEVRLHQVPKNNGVILDAISVMAPGQHIAPSIYLEDLYLGIEDGNTIPELAEQVVLFSENCRPPIILPDDFFMEYEKIKHRVCYRLVNYEKNKELLKGIPHKKFLDLAVVYYYFVESEFMGNGTILIREADMERLGVTLKQVEEDANVNTPHILPWQFMSIFEVMEKMIEEKQLDVQVDLENESVMPMYVLTNQEKCLGAACILYPQVLDQIAEKLHSHFYILPSSIHECIIVPDSGDYSQEYLSKMVADINRSQVDEIEVLSDNAYYYNRDRKEIIL